MNQTIIFECTVTGAGSISYTLDGQQRIFIGSGQLDMPSLIGRFSVELVGVTPDNLNYNATATIESVTSGDHSIGVVCSAGGNTDQHEVNVTGMHSIKLHMMWPDHI